jgi:nitrite reductase/ring-hydroxylating ferredoxin subunit
MSESVLSRRCVLAIGGGALCAQALGCGTGSTSLASSIPGGSAASLSVGTVKAIAGESVAIGRDSGGVYALSLLCPHQGYDMSVYGQVSSAGIVCDVHGSSFSAAGNLLRGPAATSLSHLLVTADGAGQLTIHGDQTVGSTVRLPV